MSDNDLMAAERALLELLRKTDRPSKSDDDPQGVLGIRWGRHADGRPRLEVVFGGCARHPTIARKAIRELAKRIGIDEADLLRAVEDQLPKLQ